MRELTALLALLLLLAAGCDDSGAEETSGVSSTVGASCAFDKDCGAYEICVDGKCAQQKCTTPEKCRGADECPPEWDSYGEMYSHLACTKTCVAHTIEQPLCQAHECFISSTEATGGPPSVECPDGLSCVTINAAFRCVTVGDGLGCRSDADCSVDTPLCDIRPNHPDDVGACAAKLP